MKQMKYKYLRKIFTGIMSICLLVTMMPMSAFASTDLSSPNESLLADEAVPVEEYFEYKDVSELTEEDVLLDESGEGYTTFTLGGGRRLTMFFTEDVRYENDEGELIEYNPALIDVKNRPETAEKPESYVYENTAGDNKLYIPETLSEETPILMEKDDYAITMVPTAKTYKDFFGKTVKIKAEKAKIRDAYDKERMKKVKASYKDGNALAYIEYMSRNTGIKENIVLTARPAKNVLEFEISAKGTYPVLSDADGSIGFYDKKSDKLVSMIEPPNMNDATGEAYSEDLYYDISEKAGENDTYILTLTIDKTYLKDKKRVYPVTIDPAATWVGDSSLRDVYVSSANSSKNYYSTARTTMPIGKGSSSTFRTFIHFYNLKSAIEDAIVDTAYLDVHENDDSYSGRTIRAYRVTESWTASTITWSNQPSTASSSTASISKLIWYDDLTEGEYYTATIEVYDTNGHCSVYEYSFYVPYLDYASPEIGNITLTHSDGTVINEATWYTKESGTFNLSYSQVSDSDSGIDTSSFKCVVYKDGDKSNKLANLSSTPTYSSGKYSGNFSLSMGSLFAESGKYTFEMSVSDEQGNKTYKTVTYNLDKTEPKGVFRC